MAYFKTLLSVLSLVGVLTFSYCHTKKLENFNPYLLKVKTGGAATTLSEIQKNKILLIYFGFLSCPVVCPTTLSSMSVVFKELSKEQQDKLAFVFVDLDPERDTLTRLVEYTHYFHPSFTPVLLDLPELKLMTKYFDVSFSKVFFDSKMAYTIDHSTDIKVITPDGKMLPSIAHGLTKKEIATRLNKIINDYYKIPVEK